MDVEEQEATSNEEQQEIEIVPGPKKAKKERGPKAPVKKGRRVYLKNLVFDTNEKMLRKLLSKFGEIAEINIPLNPSTNRHRGFAFVQFSSKNSAGKAVAELNGTKWKGRVIGVALAEDKRQYELKNPSKAAVKATPEDQKNDFEDSGIEIVKQDVKVKDLGGGVAEMREEDFDELDDLVMNNINNMNDYELEDEIGDMDDDEMEGAQEIDLNDAEDEENEQKDEEEEEEEEIETEETIKAKKNRILSQKNEDLSRTLFVKGIPFDATESDFGVFCAKIGQYDYAKLVKVANETRKHNGNGFIRFKEDGIADKLIDLSKRIDKGGYIPRDGDYDIWLNGTKLQFYPAIDKSHAKELQKKREKELKEKAKGSKVDKNRKKKKTMNLENLIAEDPHGKRRLKYSVLGFNILDTETFSKLTPVDANQRKDHQVEKLEKMRNPNFFVSENRVLFKNIAREMDEQTLKASITQVCEGLPGFKPNNRIINNITVLRGEDERSGILKNKGIAFAEFANPSLAETFLKNIDSIAKAKIFNPYRTPIIEFAFEDVRKLNKLKKKLDQQKKRNEEEEKQLISEGKKTKKGTKEQNLNTFVFKKAKILEHSPNALSMAEMDELMKQVSGRGNKQRLKKYFKRHSKVYKQATATEEKLVHPEAVMPKKGKISAYDSIIPQSTVKATSLKKRVPEPLEDLLPEEPPKQLMKKVKIKKFKKEVKSDFLDNLTSSYVKKKQQRSKNWTS